ncbi:MAG: transcription elongation factor GreA [Chitinophagales bacterium]|nr:transcription elongation factor GreA [Chitinophagales bacterium]MDW8394479.1 transcription elongation factor GreA [Chitinophagales bacterium]
MSEPVYLTQEGLEKIRSELQDLRTRGRAEIARAIQEAREKGDLSENAEYHAAKEAQGFLEMRIAHLEKTLLHARLVDSSRMDGSRVMLLSSVKVRNLQTDQITVFTLVSESEANLKAGKISASSPIGKGLLGKSVGDIAEIAAPIGTIRLEIMEISVAATPA